MAEPIPGGRAALASETVEVVVWWVDRVGWSSATPGRPVTVTMRGRPWGGKWTVLNGEADCAGETLEKEPRKFVRAVRLALSTKLGLPVRPFPGNAIVAVDTMRSEGR